ncbi:MAG: alpha-amylase [Lachnospiraceae bacterium]|nr:alpha-amylase [Lachnospiraceae bacterium]
MGSKVSKKVCLGVGSALAVAAGVAVAVNVSAKKDKNVKADSVAQINGTMLQAFEWYVEPDGKHWSNLESMAADFADKGITAMWLPPAYKADNPENAGYSTYDLYDLGEFDQKGSVRTKYGTKEEYLSLIDTLHENNMQVYADIVLNHKAGADAVEKVKAYKVDGGSRNTDISGAYTIGAWCDFNFEGRNGKYSTFTWDASCFDGVDYDDDANNGKGENALFRFEGKNWDNQVDDENGNYDYLMFADVDFENQKVVDELTKWGKWYVDTADLDGFRLDAVKHIKYDFYKNWLTDLRKSTGKELFSVGEFWSGDVGKLNNYIKETSGTTSLFDAPLHFRFWKASNDGGGYDMRYLFDDTLVKSQPTLAVTFVDNHDSQPGQSLASHVQSWFKPLAYTAILTREGGYPCVFYGDYYGTGNKGIEAHKNSIDKILEARKDYAYGTQHDYLNDENIIGWTREGDSVHKNSGLAALITDGAGGSKEMYVGKSHAGETWYDITGNKSEIITIDGNGNGKFLVNGGSHSIWVPEKEIVGENIVKIFYYNNSWDDSYIHYSVAGGEWTKVPGEKMTVTNNKDYKYFEMNLDKAKSITVCFNDGSDNWDSNNGSNYTLRKGIYTIKDGSVSDGAPNGVEVVNPTTTPDPTKTPAPSKTPTPTEAPTPTPPVETETPYDYVATVYYYNANNWSNVNIHYSIDGKNWTDVPGVAMKKGSNGYYTYTLELGKNEGAVVCFNDGNGNWDSRNAQNYSIGTGSFTIKDGNVTAGEPK